MHPVLYMALLAWLIKLRMSVHTYSRDLGGN
jgi:hypothetical protein